MKAILSCTYDDLYLFNLPFAIYSWHLLDVGCIVFVPDEGKMNNEKLILVVETIRKFRNKTGWRTFDAPKEKQATYAQCARLYAAAPDPTNEVLITADADMCVFNKEYWERFDYNGDINIIGSDLVPLNQVPMCYIAMPAVAWDHVMQIGKRSYQECLDELLGGIEAENFRGNYWGKDQETAYKQIFHGPVPNNMVVCHPRAQPGTQFATRRADRDGWSYAEDIIDAHLPRPGHEPPNFHKIYDLFVRMYPDLDLQWMIDYRNEYVKLMA